MLCDYQNYEPARLYIKIVQAAYNRTLIFIRLGRYDCYNNLELYRRLISLIYRFTKDERI